MTGTESTRAIVRIEAGISALNEKLDKVPDWTDIDRQEARRDAEQKKQDEAIKAVESKISGLMMAVVVTSLGAAGSLIIAIATSGF